MANIKNFWCPGCNNFFGEPAILTNGDTVTFMFDFGSGMTAVKYCPQCSRKRDEEMKEKK